MTQLQRYPNDQIIIPLSGELRVQEAVKLRESALIQIDEGKNRLIFDLSGLTYIDSAGLGVMVTLYKRVSQRGGSLTVRGAGHSIKNIFETARLSKVFHIH